MAETFFFGLAISWLSAHNQEVLVAQSCPSLCDPTDCSPPGSSVHGVLQARILEWVATSFSGSGLRAWEKNLGIACHYTDLKAEAQEADSLTPSPTEN